MTLCVDPVASMPSTRVPIPDQNLHNEVSEEIEKLTYLDESSPVPINRPHSLDIVNGIITRSYPDNRPISFM